MYSILLTPSLFCASTYHHLLLLQFARSALSVFELPVDFIPVMIDSMFISRLPENPLFSAWGRSTSRGRGIGHGLIHTCTHMRNNRYISACHCILMCLKNDCVRLLIWNTEQRNPTFGPKEDSYWAFSLESRVHLTTKGPCLIRQNQ